MFLLFTVTNLNSLLNKKHLDSVMIFVYLLEKWQKLYQLKGVNLNNKAISSPIIDKTFFFKSVQGTLIHVY